MEFIITRTSIWDETKPIECAYKKMIEVWHTRTLTEEEFNEKFSSKEGLWRSKGSDHRTNPSGYITRREADKETWVINIDSLDFLMKFIEENGEVIVKMGTYYNDHPSIEIYDDYRE